MKSLFTVVVCPLFLVLLLVSACEQVRVSTEAPGKAVSGAKASEEGPVAWWKFDEGEGTVAIDTVSGEKDPIMRTFWYRQGVSGSEIKCDGFTTHIVRSPEGCRV